VLLLSGTPDGGEHWTLLAPDAAAEVMAAPEGAPAATCEGCGQTVYRLPDGGWTLGRAPWFCFPDPELVGVLAQAHRPRLRRWTVTVEAATHAEAAQAAARIGGVVGVRPRHDADQSAGLHR
jgi:hypothetical protein